MCLTSMRLPCWLMPTIAIWRPKKLTKSGKLACATRIFVSRLTMKATRSSAGKDMTEMHIARSILNQKFLPSIMTRTWRLSWFSCVNSQFLVTTNPQSLTKMKKYNRDTFNLRERIQGASRCSITLKGDNGETVYCTNKLFNKIMRDPTIEFFVQDLPSHEDSYGRKIPGTKWICAFLPSRW